jgi:anti-sigma factor RsiW
MDCLSFQRRHDAFVDDTLPGVEMAAMREHLTGCVRCARRDADVRRALLLVRNLPQLRVSGGFEDRLRGRILAESAMEQPARRARRPVRGIAAAAAVVVAIAAGSLSLQKRVPLAPVLRPVVVTYSAPAPYASDDPAPAYVASMSTGIPMWPALMLAEEGPLLFANGEAQAVSFTREP